MTLIRFPDYAPDLTDVNAGYTSRLNNCIARADGYGPANDLLAFTQALPDVCRGYFFARNLDSSISLFAATATRLYELNNTTLTWTDVSKGGSAYTSISNDAQWSFAQYNSVVVATQKNIVMQAFNLTSSTAFADLAGSPPQAGYIAVVGSFLVASDLLGNPYRVFWCDVDNIIQWTAGTGLCDFQDFQDGGRVRCAEEISSNVAIVCQDGIIRRMTYAPGSAEIFQFDKLHQDRGILAPYSLAIASGVAYFLSTRGFVQIDATGTINNIGEEKVDRTFLGLHPASVSPDIRSLAYDNGNPQLVLGANDPSRSLYVVCYKSVAGVAGQFDRALAYHTSLGRWAPFMCAGEFLEPVAKPGLTLEGLDAIAPGAQVITGAADNGSGKVRLTIADSSGMTTGDYKTISGVVGTTEANGTNPVTVIDATHIDLASVAFVHAYVSGGGVVGGSVDALTFSLDDVSTSALPALSVFSSKHALSLFSGPALEATLQIPEQQAGRQRIDINGMVPATDAANAFCSVGMRETLSAAEVIGVEVNRDEDGVCWVLENTRFARARLRIPAGEVWSYASGIDPDAQAGSYN